MGLVFRAHIWRTGNVIPNMDAYWKELSHGFEGMASEIRWQLQEVVVGWKVAVTFKVTVYRRKNLVMVSITPGGPGLPVWKWVSGGVPGHYIKPRRKWKYKGFRRFRSRLKLRTYVPGSSARMGGAWGGVGSYHGGPWYRFRVWWPGITPRRFELVIAENYRVEFYRRCSWIVTRAAKAAEWE